MYKGMYNMLYVLIVYRNKQGQDMHQLLTMNLHILEISMCIVTEHAAHNVHLYL